MQRFLARLPRLSWANLSVRAKLATITVLMLALVLVWTLINGLLLASLSTQTSESVATAIELRSLAQDIQLNVESMQRVQQRLIQDFDQVGFDPRTTPLRTEYVRLADQILITDLPALRDRILELADPAERTAIQAEFQTFEDAINQSQVDFGRQMTLIEQLATPETGALQVMYQHSTAIETLTLETDNPDLVTQIGLINSLEGSLIQTGSTQDQLALRQEVQEYRVIYELRTPLFSQSQLLIGEITSYLESVDTVYNQLFQLNLADRTARVNLDFARDTASRLTNIATSEADRQTRTVQTLAGNLLRNLLIGLVVQVLGVGVLMFFFARDITSRLHVLQTTTQRFELGNFRARAYLTGQDELAELGRSFNNMAEQLEDLVGGLEARVAERTRDLSITAEIGQAVVEQRDPRELMQEIVDLIRDRFDFYHVQVFLVDEAGDHARLVASTGTAGRTLLARRHSLPVGSQSVIGTVTASATPVIASDTDTSAVHRRNELLPDTRSEMALPMRIGGRVIGALDVQSVAPNAFNPDTVAVFQIMADQLAVALENGRLHGQLAMALEEVKAMERRITAETWKAFQEGQGRDPNAPLGYAMIGDVLMPLQEAPPSVLEEAIERGMAVAAGDGGSDVELALPIRVRGEVIGAFSFSGEHLANLTGEDVALVEAVIDRVGMALENMRLVQQTVRRAEYEQIVNEITAKIVGSTDVNFILQTTVKELGRALRAPQTSVQLRREGTGTRDEQ